MSGSWKKYGLDKWGFGANFYPSNAINQLEMWQEDTFSPELIDRELGFAAGIGMKIMRVYLHDLVFYADEKGFISRMEKYLEISSAHGIKTVFVFFDDCWQEECRLGKQPEPIPYVHNSGWVQSPGNKVVADPSQLPRLERYIRTVVRHFAGDRRILMWDLYNEPGNGTAGDNLIKDALPRTATVNLLKSVFAWARAEHPVQPLSAGVWVWGDSMDELNWTMINESDVVSFHCYGPPDYLTERLWVMRFLAKGRPVICTEFMARSTGSTFAGCLPVFEKYSCPAICWGLVKGKSNTTYPWGWCAEKGEPLLPFHDVFNPDGSLLCPDEEQVFARYR
ncbi:MAG: 1,4-beta-xylanase [Lentisphaerae bacterium]|nr:1,4-beta-xylanase [Lentisphaerota bacterium]